MNSHGFVVRDVRCGGAGGALSGFAVVEAGLSHLEPVDHRRVWF